MPNKHRYWGDWLGATVSFTLFGKKRIGKVHGYSSYYGTLDVELWDGQKRILVRANYQAFRREAQNDD